VIDVVGTGKVLVSNLDMGELEYLLGVFSTMPAQQLAEYGMLMGFSKPDVSLLFKFDNLSQVLNAVKFISKTCNDAEFRVQECIVK
jgi:hypothetical protein